MTEDNHAAILWRNARTFEEWLEANDPEYGAEAKVQRDRERLQLAADVLAWTQGYECTDDDSLSAAKYDGCYEWAALALADIDKARADD